MRDTSKHIVPARRLPPSATRNQVPVQDRRVMSGPASSARVEALRRLVAAGQYHVSPKWLALRICRAAGVKYTE